MILLEQRKGKYNSDLQEGNKIATQSTHKYTNTLSNMYTNKHTNRNTPTHKHTYTQVKKSNALTA